MGYALCWVAFATLAAIIASAKNRNGWAWFFVGLIFGLFSLIAAACVGKLDARGQPIGSDETSCPFCAEPIRLQAVLCRHCRSDIPPRAAEEGPETVGAGEGTRAIMFVLGTLALTGLMVVVFS